MKWKSVPRVTKLSKWHRWFAWYPVRIGGKVYWLEYIDRRIIRRYDKYSDSWQEIYYRNGADKGFNVGL